MIYFLSIIDNGLRDECMHQAGLYQQSYQYRVNGYVWFPFDKIVHDMGYSYQASRRHAHIEGEHHQKRNCNCNKKKNESLMIC